MFPKRLLIPAFASLAVAGALGLANSGTPPAALDQAAAAPGRPNVLVIETDDQSRRTMRVGVSSISRPEKTVPFFVRATWV